MVYYNFVKAIIHASSLTKLIINIVLRYHSLRNSIITNRELIFTFEFWLLLCYFFGIKQKLSALFYSLINSQIKKQNKIIKAYF